MTQVTGLGLYVLGDEVRHDDGRVWQFSSRASALAALRRLNCPGHEPVGGWGPGDLWTFAALLEAVS